MHTRKSLLIGSIICLIGAFFYCYEFVLRIVPGILQQELISAFGNIPAATFGQISALYYFAYSPMQLPVGILMDRFGARKLLTLACFCCATGSFLFSYPSNLLVAGVGRFLVGFGSAFAFVGVLSCAIAWLPYKLFSLVAGLMTSIGMFGLIYGEIKLTELSHSLSLGSILQLLVYAGIVLTIMIFLIVRENPNSNNSDHKNIPMKDFLQNVLHVLKTPEIWLIGFSAACLYTSLSIFGELWGQSYLEHAHHLTKVKSAKTISFLFLGWAIGAPFFGYISDKYNNRVIPLLVGTIFSFICISIILYIPELSSFSLCAVVLLYGIFSAAEIIAFIMANECIAKILPGTIFAVINMIVTLGGVIFQPLVGKLLDIFNNGKTLNGVYIYATKDYQLSLSVMPTLLIITVFILFILKTKYQRN